MIPVSVIIGFGLLVLFMSTKANAQTGNPVIGGSGIGTPPSPVVRGIAVAFATAEGFYGAKRDGIDPLPRRANNPGDLERGDKGFGTIAGKTIYGTIDDGWNALYAQIQAIINGTSEYYDTSFSWFEIAKKYTGDDNAEQWAATVAQSLNVDADSTIGEYIGA